MDHRQRPDDRGRSGSRDRGPPGRGPQLGGRRRAHPRHARPRGPRRGSGRAGRTGRRTGVGVAARRRATPEGRADVSGRRRRADGRAHARPQRRPRGVLRSRIARALHGGRGPRARHQLHRSARRRPREVPGVAATDARSRRVGRSIPDTVRSCWTRTRSSTSTSRIAPSARSRCSSRCGPVRTTWTGSSAEIYPSEPDEVRAAGGPDGDRPVAQAGGGGTRRQTRAGRQADVGDRGAADVRPVRPGHQGEGAVLRAVFARVAPGGRRHAAGRERVARQQPDQDRTTRRRASTT